MAESKKFVDGLIVKRHEKAPEYVICALSFKAEEFAKYLAENQVNGWLNVDVKLSQGKKYYAELNTWSGKAKTTPTTNETPKSEESIESAPQEAVTEEYNAENFPF